MRQMVLLVAPSPRHGAMRRQPRLLQRCRLRRPLRLAGSVPPHGVPPLGGLGLQCLLIFRLLPRRRLAQRRRSRTRSTHASSLCLCRVWTSARPSSKRTVLRSGVLPRGVEPGGVADWYVDMVASTIFGVIARPACLVCRFINSRLPQAIWFATYLSPDAASVRRLCVGGT
jgi:hypothetical protein